MNKFKAQFHRFKRFIFIDDQIKRAQYETPNDILKVQELYSSLSLQFLTMLIAASLISSLGLISDSGVTIVGAMLIAPLMKPIMSLSYGIALGNTLLKIRSFLTLTLGIILTIFISYIAELTLDFNNITNQMGSRIEPNLFDLGVAIAAGIAAALAMTRKSVADSLPGVAIAVALVPPLCVSGISLAMGQMHAFYGSFILFGTNLFAIIISAVLVFLLNGYGSIKHTVIVIPVLFIILSVLSIPLQQSLNIIIEDDEVQDVMEVWLHENYPHNTTIHPADLNKINVIDMPDHIYILVELKAFENALSETELSFIHHQLEERFEKPVNLKIQVLLKQEFTSYSKHKKNERVLIYGAEALIPRK